MNNNLNKAPEILLNLPWPPSANAMYRRSKSNTVRLAPPVKAFRQQVEFIIERLKKTLKTFNKPMPDPKSLFSVLVVAYPPNNRRRDIDNLLKVALDSITYAGIWEDDSQVVYIQITKARPSKLMPDGLFSVVLREVDDRPDYRSIEEGTKFGFDYGG